MYREEKGEGMDSLFRHRDTRLDLEVCRLKDDAVLAVSYYKVSGGLKYLVWRYESVDLVKITANAARWGIFSKRPYQPGQGCDGSVNDCALALFVYACRGFGLDPEAVYQAAYEGETLASAYDGDLLAFARWQGLNVPRVWGEAAFDQVCASLHAVNYHYLAQVFEEHKEGVWTSTWAA